MAVAAALAKSSGKKTARSSEIIKRSPLDPNVNYPIPEGAAVAGVATISFWRAIYAGHLKTYRVGRRRVVSGQQILDWLNAGGKTGQTKKGGE